MGRAIYGAADGDKRGRAGQILQRIIVTAAFAACVLFIWHNSMESAETSAGRSGKVLEMVNRILEPIESKGMTEHFVRKLAHFSEYGLEGVLTILLFAVYRLRLKKGFWAMLFIGLATAMIDESIQFFSPGRAPGILDVCIDMQGFICGMFFAAMIIGVGRNIRAGRRVDNS